MSTTEEGRRIIAFYEGSGTDDRGRFLDDILAFNDKALESTHDYIQWLFPTVQRSAANPQAPCLDDTAIQAFRRSASLRARLRQSLDRMLLFYGLAWDGSAIVAAPSFTEHDGWLTPGNHNHLRLTRMLASLCSLGEKEIARTLFRCLRRIVEDDTAAGRRRVSAQTLEFWGQASCVCGNQPHDRAGLRSPPA